MLGRAAMAAAVMLSMSSMGAASTISAVDLANRADYGPYSRGAIVGGSYRAYGTKGAGISMAQQKRASNKRRNVKRHRAQMRK